MTNVNDYFDRDTGPESPVVAGANISELGLDITTWGLTSDHDFRPTFKRRFGAGDVLFHSRNTEKIGVPGFRGVTGEKIFVLRSKDEEHLLQTFLPWLMRAPSTRAYISRSLAGSVNKFLNWTPLARFELDLPPIDEQRELAELLWAAERHTAKSRLLAEQTRLAATAYADFLMEQVRGDDSPVAELRDICAIPITNGLFRRKEHFGSGYPLINVLDIYSDFRVDALRLDHVPASPSEVERFSALPGDVIFNRSSIVKSGVGHACLVPESFPQAVFECHLMRVRVNRDRFDPRFVARYALSRAGRRYIDSVARTTTMTTINQQDLAAMTLPLIPLEEQRSIADRLDQVETEGRAADRSVSTARSLANSLLRDSLG